MADTILTRSPPRSEAQSRAPRARSDRESLQGQTYLNRRRNRTRCVSLKFSRFSKPRCGKKIGIDFISWEYEYPHSDPVWPESPESLAKNLEGLRADEIDKIKQHLAQYDYETRHDSIFDSVASGNLDLDAIVREALGDQEPS